MTIFGQTACNYDVAMATSNIMGRWLVIKISPKNDSLFYLSMRGKLEKKWKALERGSYVAAQFHSVSFPQF